MKRHIVYVVMSCLLVGACKDQRPTTPQAFVDVLFKAIESDDLDAVYALLSLESQRQLSVAAKLATAQAGGQIQYRPQDLLATSLTVPASRLHEVKVAPEASARVELKLYDETGKLAETLVISRQGESWALELPRDAL